MKLVNAKVTVFFFAVLLSVALMSSAHAQQAQQKPLELTFSHIWPASAVEHNLYAEWVQRVEKGTNGRVKITIYPSNTLCPPTEVWNGIKSGAVSIGSTFANYHRSGFEFNNSHLFFWLGGPSSIELSIKQMDLFREKFPALIKEFSGAKVLWFGAQGPRMLLATKPVRTVDELKGMILRPATPAEVKLLQDLKAVTPSFMPMSEVYTSLQKGIIQGVWVCTEVLQSYRLAEVVKYVNNINFGVGQNKYVAMNWELWNKLSPDDQKVFERESAWAKEQDIKVWTQGDEDAIKYAKTKGVEVIDFPPEEQAKLMSVVVPIQDAEAAKLDASGYPGTELLRFMRETFKKDK